MPPSCCASGVRRRLSLGRKVQQGTTDEALRCCAFVRNFRVTISRTIAVWGATMRAACPASCRGAILESGSAWAACQPGAAQLRRSRPVPQISATDRRHRAAAGPPKPAPPADSGRQALYRSDARRGGQPAATRRRSATAGRSTDRCRARSGVAGQLPRDAVRYRPRTGGPADRLAAAPSRGRASRRSAPPRRPA